ncbi:hypothetical protein BASA62_005669 [Batrachochytrium salamandrivorans]|nr:hypothetical protein BASA62_005669 [Batrachochytrium salamandrivorans]
MQYSIQSVIALALLVSSATVSAYNNESKDRSLQKRACSDASKQGRQACKSNRANQRQCIAKVTSDLLQCLSVKPPPPTTPPPPPTPEPSARSRRATVNILPDSASTLSVRIQGTVTFMQASANAPLVVTANVTGVPEGEHGWHVHTSGNTFPNCGAAGPHWNPFGVNHGAPGADVRHEGDFGNFLAAEDGSFVATYTDTRATLFGTNSIIGRALVLHGGVDDLGITDNPLSITTGNAGSRLACGVIGILVSDYSLVSRLSTAIGPLLVETGIGSLLTRSLVSRVRLLERSVTKRTPINVICSGTDNDVLALNVQGQLVRSQRWFWSRRTKQLYRNRYWLTPQVRPKTVKQRHSFALMETLRTCGDSASLQKYVTRQLFDTSGFFKDPSFDQLRAHGTRYLMLARMVALWTARKAIQIGILVDTHPFSVDHCILCDQQLLSTSIFSSRGGL